MWTNKNLKTLTHILTSIIYIVTNLSDFMEIFRGKTEIFEQDRRNKLPEYRGGRPGHIFRTDLLNNPTDKDLRISSKDVGRHVPTEGLQFTTGKMELQLWLNTCVSNEPIIFRI